jgi:hypothetical protein
LNGSKVATSGSALTFDGTGFAVGATPSATFKIYTRTATTGGAFQSDNGVNTGFVVRFDSNTTLIGNDFNQPLVFLTNNAEKMRLDSSGNLGLGVSPSAWRSNYKALQINTTGAVWSSPQFTFFSDNTYQDSSDVSRYLTTAPAVLYALNRNSGVHAWYNAPSGTAGDAITFTQAMTLDASGNLVVGNSTASQRFQVERNWNGSTWGYFVNTDSGAGAAAGILMKSNTGDLGAISLLSSANSPADALFVRSLSTNPLVFGTNNTERARITSGGDLLVAKTAASDSTLGVEIQAAGTVVSTRSGSTNSQSTLIVYSTGATAYRFYVGMDGTVNATNTTISAVSDQRLKENIQDLDVGLNKIMALKPRKFDWKAGKGKDIKGDRGWIAQEFEQVFPDMIDTWKDPAPEGEEPYKSVRADLIPVLVKAIQELTARVAQLESK